MKNGTLYAKRLKEVYSKLRGSTPKPEPGVPTDPTEQLVVAVLGSGTSLAQGQRAYQRLLENMIDLNEIRVSSAGEVAAVLGNTLPEARLRAEALIRALNSVFRKEHAVSLARLIGKGVRESRTYLESLDGVGPYAAASVVHWSLEGHAIPVSEALLSALKAANMVHPNATVAEVQAFLERHVPAGEARQFVLAMDAFAQSHPAPRPARDGSARSKPARRAGRSVRRHVTTPARGGARRGT
ncbi:MAG TPA: hypothetical protein VGM03_15610 [Phycisphaerae bacterium]|jgi:endonuclease III